MTSRPQRYGGEPERFAPELERVGFLVGDTPRPSMGAAFIEECSGSRSSLSCSSSHCRWSPWADPELRWCGIRQPERVRTSVASWLHRTVKPHGLLRKGTTDGTEGHSFESCRARFLTRFPALSVGLRTEGQPLAGAPSMASAACAIFWRASLGTESWLKRSSSDVSRLGSAGVVGGSRSLEPGRTGLSAWRLRKHGSGHRCVARAAAARDLGLREALRRGRARSAAIAEVLRRLPVRRPRTTSVPTDRQREPGSRCG